MAEPQQPPPFEREPQRHRPEALSPQQSAIAEELRALDPHLAGLYEHALELLPRIDEPGFVYFIAQAGREITRGVGRKLLEETSGGIELDTDDLPAGEGHRGTIAEMLQLPPQDPRVDIWFNLHRRFSEWMKFREAAPPADRVRDAFERLSDFLYGRIGPYFDTQADLDRLLSLERPTQTDAERLQGYLLRPVQRAYFFGKLPDARWIEVLDRASAFSSPPDRRVDPDRGTWSMRAWPEGEYLARVAEDAPQQVADILSRIPPGNNNPAVWNLVAEAALKLPPDEAGLLVPGLLQALKEAPPVVFNRTCVDLVATLAAAEKEEAFALADHLLFVASPSSEIDGRDSPEDTRRFRTLRNDEVLVRLDEFDFRRFLEKALPGLERYDATRTLRLLLVKLRHVLRLSRAVGAGTDGGFVWYSIFSARSRHRDPHEVIAQLYEAAGGLAERLATQRPEVAQRTWSLVEEHEGEPFTRIGYRILSVAGESLSEQLHSFFCSSEAVEGVPPCREIAAVVRRQFRNASPASRRIYRYALERGPGGPELWQTLRWSQKEDPEESDIEEMKALWQRRRLAWFRGEIPDELRALAESVGSYGTKPSVRDQELAEVGTYSHAGVSHAAWEAPISTDELVAMSGGRLLDFLAEWRPETAPSSAERGLEDAIEHLLFEQPEKVTEIAAALDARGLAPNYARGVLAGLSRAVAEGKSVDWAAALRLSAWMVEGAPGETETSSVALKWRWAVGAVLRLLREGCANDRIPETEAKAVVAVMQQAARAPSVWESKEDAPETLEGAVSLGLNDPAGHLVQAGVSLALWLYRLEEDRETAADASSPSPLPMSGPAYLVDFLEDVLSYDGVSAVAARAMLGQFVPQVNLLAAEWLAAQADTVFRGGATDPANSPTWGAYLTQAGFYESVFEDLREWYGIAAGAAASAAEAGSEWSVTKGLVRHVTWAYLRGSVSFGDPDRLLETTYQHASPSDRSDVYWTLFRGWSDAAERPPDGFVERAVALWKWRLEILAESPDRKEAEGLRWFLRTPYIPDDQVLRLGIKTLELEDGDGDLHPDWERLLELAAVDVDLAYRMGELMLTRTLVSEYPYVQVERVKPVLEEVLASGSPETEEAARRLIHRLGDRGFVQFGDLLRSE